jgi:hypothetical protein
MNNKEEFLVQPYWTGTKTSKSLVLVIPSPVVKLNKINPSTGFILRPTSQGINLLYIKERKKNDTVDSDRFAAKDQQVSIIKGLD